MGATKAKAAAKPAARRRGGPGRPKKELNATEVRKLAELGCTHVEIAGFLGISTDTFARRLKDDEAIAAAFAEGVAELKMSLRRMQLDAAKNSVHGSNHTILIWLGKTILGQTDKPNEDDIEDAKPLVIEFDGEDGDDD